MQFQAIMRYPSVPIRMKKQTATMNPKDCKGCRVARILTPCWQKDEMVSPATWAAQSGDFFYGEMYSNNTNQ